MGFICPICNKDFYNNKEWFDDHIKAHYYDEQKEKLFVIKKEENIANLKSIQNAVKSDRIRVWINFDGFICFQNTKTKNEIKIMPYYDMNGETVKR